MDPLSTGIFLLACWGSLLAVSHIGNNVLKQRVLSIPGERDSTYPELIVAAVPFFILLIGLELLLARGHFTEGAAYDLPDSVSSITGGAMQLMMDIATAKAIGMFPYLWVWVNLSKDYGYRFPLETASAWVACFVFVDFCYYWFHRGGHEVAFMWAAHASHHSSEHYNLSTALRQSMFQKWFRWMYYLPLGLLFPPALFVVHSQWNTVYQFWVHTVMVRRLGPLEWVFNTPSHHRVHHDRRLHRNYGGTLIVWDRLFGTFLDESCTPADTDERVVYGVTHAVGSWNPWTVQVTHYQRLLGRVWREPSFVAKLKLLVRGPGLRSVERDSPPEVGPNVQRVRWTSDLAWPMWWYSFAHFAVFLVLLVRVLLAAPALASFRDAMVALAPPLASATALGMLLDGSVHGWSVEIARSAAMVAVSALTLREAAAGGDARVAAVLTACSVAAAIVNACGVTFAVATGVGTAATRFAYLAVTAVACFAAWAVVGSSASPSVDGVSLYAALIGLVHLGSLVFAVGADEDATRVRTALVTSKRK